MLAASRLKLITDDTMKPKNNSEFPPAHNDMWILSTLKEKGIEFLLLGVAVWWLQSENVEIRRDMNRCQEEKLEVYRAENAALREVIGECTIAIQELKQQLIPLPTKRTMPPIKRKKDSIVIDPALQQ